MAAQMDFFRAQDDARGRTALLVVLLACALTALAGTLYAVAVIGLAKAQGVAPQWWQPKLFIGTAGTAFGVVLGGSLVRIAELSSGGGAVARSLGGRLVVGGAADPLERRYLNIVQEMALASGLPVPECYVIEGSAGINAFAAGNSPEDAAVGVTRGALQSLTRDELQGVIAHEFSHIGNGDMRLNLRLIGTVAGLLALVQLGYLAMRLAGSSGGGRKKGGNLVILVAGLALVVVGAGGMLFARIIQACVSRQREFLADASAVQFTRNPQGLAGAFRKIAAHGATVAEGDDEARHLFFASTPGFLESLFSTHPPLDERLKRIDPASGGDLRIPASARRPAADAATASPAASGFAGAAPMRSTASASVPDATPHQIQEAVTFRGALPEPLVAAATDLVGSLAVVFSLILSKDAAVRDGQLKALSGLAGGEVVREVVKFEPVVRALPRGSRLPLLDLALPTLRQLSPDQRALIRDGVSQATSMTDDALLHVLLESTLRRHLGLPPPIAPAAIAVEEAHAVVLSALVHASAQDEAEKERAYLRAFAQLRTPRPPPYGPAPSSAQVAAALASLLRLSVAQRREIVRACGVAMLHDGRADPGEVEMVRAVGDSLGIVFPTGF
ncbi:MAG: M48 family metallopeptidase [Verrucomicrobiota bacterium]